ncbi:N-ethylmaleimide reductase [Paraburkholderia sacchari]|uniref:alkene reductase n=1 Tax=Paraburkholderia sacchari TaxID=159450 RepID=UPI0039A4BBE1
MRDLFSPFDLAGQSLSNRIVMAPLTRSRSPDEIPLEITALYYAQRATAGLIVSEGAPISPEGRGNLYTPGLFTPEQVEGWRLVTQSVHAVGGKIFAQLWHVGRVSHSSLYRDGAPPVGPSTKRAVGAPSFAWQDDGTPGLVEVSAPRALDTVEVARVVEDYAKAAVHAIEAGFDGIEIHGANGYLVDQFLNPKINDRTDRYTGATIEGRIRFALDIVDAVAARIGPARTGIRLSPYGQVFDMPLYQDIDATFEALVAELGQRKIAYVHMKDHTRVDLGLAAARAPSAQFDALRVRLRKLLPHTALMLAGGLTGERAAELITSGEIDLAAFGRPFIPNPDLVARLRHGWPLSPPDPATFYGGDAKGYIDQPPYTPAPTHS